MLQDTRESLKEVAQAMLPIVVVMLLVHFLLLGTPLPEVGQFIAGTAMVVAGFVLFLMGVKVGLLPMGEAMGAELPKRGSILLILLIAFSLGLFTTMAEPDVRVLTGMVEGVSNGGIDQLQLILVISAGVGFYFAAAILRVIVGAPMRHILLAGYSIILFLSFFTPPEFLAIAFDAGGVTTGPLTVPVMLAVGIGIVSVLGGKSALADGFGLMGVASIGPIIGVMLLGVVLY